MEALALAKVGPVVLQGLFKLLHESLKESNLRHEVERLKREKDQDAEKNAEYRKRCQELDEIERARREYPRPKFLPDADPRTVNIAIFGSSGVGKSSLINALMRKRDAEDGAAKVGVTETTQEPSKFAHEVSILDEERQQVVHFMTLNYFDLPGGGTDNFRAANYVSTFGLRYFDVVLVAFHDRVNETEKEVLAECKKHNINFCVVRTRTDEAVDNDNRVYSAKASETVDKIRKAYEPELGGVKIFPVSVVKREDPAYPLAELEREILRKVWQARDLKQLVQQSLTQEKFVNLMQPQIFPSQSWADKFLSMFGKRMSSLRDLANLGKATKTQKSEFAVGLAGVGHLRAKL